MHFILPSKLFDWCPMMILLLTWIWMNQSCPPWSLHCSVSLSCLWSPLEHCCWWWSWRWWHNTVSNHQPVFTDNYQMIAQSVSQTSHKVSADSYNLLSLLQQCLETEDLSLDIITDKETELHHRKHNFILLNTPIRSHPINFHHLPQSRINEERC